jgi:hypothetical protein
MTFQPIEKNSRPRGCLSRRVPSGCIEHRRNDADDVVDHREKVQGKFRTYQISEIETDGKG